ncbi:MAG: DNA repair protein RecN [Anaerolineaceae bacterium]|nr:DNA repair protein RecN [Anaerolineaceae bacterium]
MLEELRIRNFAIIDELDLTFAPGFNVITGETGAGKSIMIDALELLLGGKTDNAFLRAGADRALVEGNFALDARAQNLLRPLLEQEGLLEDGAADFVVLARELRDSGRSMARVNGITVRSEILKEIGEALVDVHGQSEHLSLLKSSTHIDLLDRFADLLEMRAAMAAMVERVGNVRREMHTLLEDEAALKRRADRLRQEVEEIEAAKLQPGEDDELRAERNRLGNSEQLATLSGEAIIMLMGDDRADSQSSAVDSLMRVTALLEKLARIDPEMGEQHEMADVLSQQAQELALTLESYVESVEHNPQRLDEVEERLEAINMLRRRYGATIEAVIEYGERARAELDSIDHSEERLDELRAEESKLLNYIGEMGLKISKFRQQVGARLSESVIKELADLRMEATRFEVAISYEDDPEGCFVEGRRVAFSATGIDQVEFMMSANPGEPLRPLAKVASGGETARIMLALKRVLSQADHTPTLIFDEIDQGIGGRVGAVVGEKLWTLTHGHQVLVVTHLPQLAGFADRHFKVAKDVKGERVKTEVIPLEDAARVQELTEMLGAIGDSGNQTARELLGDAETRKEAARQAMASRKKNKTGQLSQQEQQQLL